MERSFWLLAAAGIILILMLAGSGCTDDGNGDVTAPTTAPPLTTAVGGTGSAPAGYSRYEDPAYGFRLEYPSDWAVREGETGSVVAFVSPEEDAADAYQERLIVTVEKSSLHIDDYLDQRIDELKQNISYFDQMQRSNMRLDENLARKFVYTGGRGMQRFRWVELVVMRQDTVYVFTFQAEESRDQDYIQQREKMFGSVELIS